MEKNTQAWRTLHLLVEINRSIQSALKFGWQIILIFHLFFIRFQLIRQIFQEENITQDSWQTSRDGKHFIVSCFILTFCVNNTNFAFKIEVPVTGQNLAERIVDRLSYYNVGKTEDSSIM